MSIHKYIHIHHYDHHNHSHSKISRCFIYRARCDKKAVNHFGVLGAVIGLFAGVITGGLITGLIG